MQKKHGKIRKDINIKRKERFREILERQIKWFFIPESLCKEQCSLHENCKCMSNKKSEFKILMKQNLEIAFLLQLQIAQPI